METSVVRILTVRQPHAYLLRRNVRSGQSCAAFLVEGDPRGIRRPPAPAQGSPLSSALTLTYRLNLQVRVPSPKGMPIRYGRSRGRRLTPSSRGVSRPGTHWPGIAAYREDGRGLNPRQGGRADEPWELN